MRTIISGATGGMGQAIAERLARDGDASLVLAVRDAERGAALADRLRATGSRIAVCVGDARDPEMGNVAVDAAMSAFGGLDALVVASGTIAHRGAMADLSLHDFQAAFDANTRPLFLLAQAAYPALKESRGAIVAITSTGALHPVTGLGGYAASKAAMRMVARQLALEWGPDGIRVNCIAPGPTATTMAPAYGDPAVRSRRASTLPLRRISEAEDIAESVAFLLGPGGRGITGIDLIIDGGMNLTTMQLSGDALGRGAE